MSDVFDKSTEVSHSQCLSFAYRSKGLRFADLTPIYSFCDSKNIIEEKRQLDEPFSGLEGSKVVTHDEFLSWSAAEVAVMGMEKIDFICN